MNTEPQIKQFLVTMGELFPGGMSTVKAQAYYSMLKDDLVHTNLKEVLERLCDRFTFFPTVRDIKDTLGTRKQTRRELATEFVDTMISTMEGSGNIYEIAGSDNCKFWQECTGMSAGMTKTDLHSGKLETRFQRSQWIDNAERAYQTHDNEKQLAAAQNIAQITGDHEVAT
jgi:hypothetical protein